MAKGKSIDEATFEKIKRMAGQIEYSSPKKIIKFDQLQISSGIEDLNDSIGSEFPDRAQKHVRTFKRDPRVRDFVRCRAKGKCEYCGELSFLMENGKRYLEAHHIIALADEGKDKPNNVINYFINPRPMAVRPEKL